MAARSGRRKKLVSTKALAKANRFETQGFRSNYARKTIFLKSQKRKGLSGWGFDYPEKPWK